MSFRLPPLPYPADALEPHISAASLVEHHDQHHRAYVQKVDDAVRGTSRECWPLERLVRETNGPLFDNAAQAWNHEFYFACLSSRPQTHPPARLAEAIDAAFGDLGSLRREFGEAAVGHFGSGWVWLVADPHGRLVVQALHDAGTPLRDGLRPLLACDVWEHAYYLDRRHDRAAYVEAFWRLVDWDFAARQLAAISAYVSRARADEPSRAAS